MEDRHQNHEAARSFYNRISRAYDLLADADEHVARERGLALLEARPGESMLEIGFGTGRSLVALARAVGPSGRVAGIDIAEGMQAIAVGRLQAEVPDAKVDLQVGAVPPLPWPDGSFDGVILSFTLELFPPSDLPVVLSEIRRVLRPGGRLAVAGMASVRPGEDKSLMEQSYEWLHHHFPHIVDCRPIDAASLLREAGFRVTREQRSTIWTMPVAVVLAVPGGRG